MKKHRFDRTPRAPWNRMAGTSRHPGHATGKHVPNPGYVAGDNWIECQRCGFDLLASQAREDGYREGLIVCPSCYDAPHPQDFVHAFEDTLTPAEHATGPDDTGSVVEGEDVNGASLIWTPIGDDPTGSTEVPGPVGTTIETL